MTRKPLKFHDDIPSILNDNFKHHYVLVFDLISLQHANDIYHYPELFREPLMLDINFSFPLKHVTEFIALGKRISPVAVDRFGVVRRKIKNLIMFISNNYSSVSRYSSIGNLVHFPLTIFRLLTMTLLLF